MAAPTDYTPNYSGANTNVTVVPSTYATFDPYPIYVTDQELALALSAYTPGTTNAGGSPTPMAATLLAVPTTTAMSGTLVANQFLPVNSAGNATYALPTAAANGGTLVDGTRVGIKNLNGSVQTPTPLTGVTVFVTGNINGGMNVSLPLRYMDQSKTFTWSTQSSTWLVTSGDLTVPSLPFEPEGAAVGATAADSGFKKRLAAGQKGRLSTIEQGTAQGTSAIASGVPLVIAEREGTAGILTEVWMALGADNIPVLERASRVRIFVDDDTTPICDQPTADFFMSGIQGGAFSSRRVGKSYTGNYAGGEFTSSYFRYLYIPFQKYLRVELVNSASNAFTAYTSAAITDLPAPLATTSQRQWKSSYIQDAAHIPQTPLAVPTINGQGQVEAIYVAMQLSGANGGPLFNRGNWQANTSYAVNDAFKPPSGQGGPGGLSAVTTAYTSGASYGTTDTNNTVDTAQGAFFEGNIEVSVDGEVKPGWITSGGEDYPNGGWGHIPVGGYPGGGAALSVLQTNAVFSFYRFFPDDPIFFDQKLDVVVNIGQKGEPYYPVGARIDATVTVSYFLDTVPAVNYRGGRSAAPSEDIAFTSAAVINSFTVNRGPWAENASNSAAASPAATVNESALYKPMPSTDAWVEMRCRIIANQTGNTAPDAALTLFARASNGDGPYGGHPGVRLVQHSNFNGTRSPYFWDVVAYESFTYLGSAKVDRGVDLTSVWLNLALKVIGNQVTAYWRYDNENFWQPFCKWQTSGTGNFYGIGTVTAGAEVSYLRSRPITTITA